MIGVVDYGAGNLQSVANALTHLGRSFTVCSRPESVERLERLILPGVGHFGAAARALAAGGLDEALRSAVAEGRPLLGICLGMQLLLESSAEDPAAPGLGLLPGTSLRLEARRVPHMGWNRVDWEGHRFHYYFAHSYVVRTRSEHVVGTARVDGLEFPVAIRSGRTLGVQFHPEKSGERGLELLEEFCSC